jgi:16S rRNA (uracil1498-N3)-methyltransferase
VRNPPWFYAPTADWSPGRVVLSPGESRHALEVLRLGPGDAVVTFDGQGAVATCAIEAVRDQRVVAAVRTTEKRTRPEPALSVYQGAAKGSKLDDIIERLAGMGVDRVAAFTSERSVVRWDGSKRARLAQRWGALAVASAKQSRSALLTDVAGPLSWDELIESVAGEPCAVVLWEEATQPMREVLPATARRVALVVGPEGGFSRSEADALEAVGARLASLGPIVLRTETAAVVGVAAVAYHYGLIG